MKREEKRLQVYEDAYMFVIQLGVKEFTPPDLDIELVRHQSLLQAFGSLAVVKAFNELVGAFVEVARLGSQSHMVGMSVSFPLAPARLSLLNAIRKENDLKPLREQDVPILSASSHPMQ